MDSCKASVGGEPLVAWLAGLTGWCVYGDAATVVSQVAAYVSLVAWLGAQLPQVVMNYRNGSVDGLSWGFLANWFLGDATNLVGCVLTNQLPFQTLLALYYVCIDVVLASQFAYYSRRAQRSSRRSSRLNHRPSKHRHSPLNVMGQVSRLALAASAVGSADAAPIKAVFGLADLAGSDLSMTIGHAVSWLCAFLYLSSRLPQIIKNYRRKSTSGTSMLLFFSALTGNVAYTLSIVLSADARGPDGWQFLVNELPYLVGSAGTVCFDVTILTQSVWYKNRCSIIESAIEVTDEVIEHRQYHRVHRDSRLEHPHQLYPDSALVTALFPVSAHTQAMDIGTASPTFSSSPDCRTPLSISLQTHYDSLA